ncbi:MFS transporter [Conexibacter stalactiti]|uniref:MFS transporter n=1 Tax=Conexibacter stalactiti TaxID=1940611 RepID=A0ABU4HP65_9ACTN|nr:MFS transporter [Conexibacter stalactiti]MDW5594502.1 MFS transporter [Conexibacter stalactiti]MEC5035144.1 MFS transporter [Conexibacter stalactiti]
MRRRLDARAGFLVVAFAFAATTAYSTVPTPLYALYAERHDFGPLVVTLVFAVYAVGVIASLLLLGHLSDRRGRKPLLCAGLVLDAASALLFVLWPALAGLLLARVVCGIATGMVTATATAWLVELWGERRPPSRPAVTATAANLGGMGVGPLLAGVLAQRLPQPLRLPYLLVGGLLLLAALLVAAVPETVARPERPAPYRPQRIVVPRAQLGRFAGAATSALTCFATLSVFSSLGPGLLADAVGSRSFALAGLIVFVIFAVAATTQIALAELPAPRLAALGQALVAGGLVLLVLALALPSLPLYVGAGVVAGAGCGALFKGCVATVERIAPTGARAEALAGLFVAAYCGTALPTIGLGLATQALDAHVALLLFGAPLLALLALPGRRLRQPAGIG